MKTCRAIQIHPVRHRFLQLKTQFTRVLPHGKTRSGLSAAENRIYGLKPFPAGSCFPYRKTGTPVRRPFSSSTIDLHEFCRTAKLVADGKPSYVCQIRFIPSASPPNYSAANRSSCTHITLAFVRYVPSCAAGTFMPPAGKLVQSLKVSLKARGPPE